MKKGFTLVELLVVLAIISIIATLGLGGYISSQVRGRDAQRKSDLRQISEALELYFSDHNRYPYASGEMIANCPHDLLTGIRYPCVWGEEDAFMEVSGTTQGNVYMKLVPFDPSPGQSYRYTVSPDGQKYRLYARLENEQDKSINPDLPGGCGTVGVCNYVIHSPNINDTEGW